MGATPNLNAALAAARAAARPVLASEPGGRSKNPEGWWYYPPTEIIWAEARRLCREYELELEFRGQCLSQRGAVATRWAVVHLPSGEEREITWEAPPFPDAETATHAVAGTVRHHERWVMLMVLSIPVERRVHEGDRVENGVIIRRPLKFAGDVREEPAPPADDDLPTWAGGPAPDPAPLDEEQQQLADEADAVVLDRRRVMAQVMAYCAGTGAAPDLRRLLATAYDVAASEFAPHVDLADGHFARLSTWLSEQGYPA